MKIRLPTLLVASIIASGCADNRPLPAGPPPPSTPTESPADEVATKVDIYSAVIRRLVTKDHTFGGGPSPFKFIYIVNGPISDAGDPLGDHFGPAPDPFSSDVIEGIDDQLRSLPPIRFIMDGDDVRLGRQGIAGVKNNGVIISLGHIERKKGRVHVSNGLWCGGTCGQWLTYVLEQRGDTWKITGTTGPHAIS
ncbi:MAG: hypothetical protein M3280_03295 [Actinomycetota bacterium]|nr:hypothetical protein [Actinomycetota bacterium]